MQPSSPPPHQSLPASARDGEVVAVAVLDVATENSDAAGWTLYRLAYDTTRTGRVTRAYKLRRLPPSLSDNSDEDQGIRFADAVDVAVSVPLLASSIVGYLGIRADEFEVSKAEVLTLDKCMRLSKLASALPTLQAAPLQRKVTAYEIAAASQAWLRNRAQEGSAVATTSPRTVEVPAAAAREPPPIRYLRRSWWRTFFTLFSFERKLNFVTAMLGLFFCALALTVSSIVIKAILSGLNVPPEPAATVLPSTWSDPPCVATFTTPADTSPLDQHVRSALRRCDDRARSTSTSLSFEVSKERIDMYQRLNVASTAPLIKTAADFVLDVAGFGTRHFSLRDNTSNASDIQLQEVAVIVVSICLLLLAFVLGMVLLSTMNARRACISTHLRVLGAPASCEVAACLAAWIVSNSATVVLPTVVSGLIAGWAVLWPLVAVLCVLAALLAQAQFVGIAVPARYGALFFFAFGVATSATTLLTSGQPSPLLVAFLVVLSPYSAGLYALTQALLPSHFQCDVSLGQAIAALLFQSIGYALGSCAALLLRDVTLDGTPWHRLIRRGAIRRRARHAISDEDFRSEQELPATRSAITLRRVRKSFDGDEVLNLSMDVQRGESIALLGHNGAGKSTLMSILLGKLCADDYDTAQVLGLDLSEDLDAIRAQIGFCPQENACFEGLSPKDNLKLVAQLRGVDVSDADIEALLRYLDIEPDANLAFMGAGQARRVSVACAFVGRPAIVLLDEPTNGIDDRSRLKIWELMAQQQKRGTTILMSTHSMEEAEAASHHIAILSGGTVVAQGAPAQLKLMHGTGYRLTLVHAALHDRSDADRDGPTKSAFQEALATALITKLIPGATVASVTPNVLHEYRLPVPAAPVGTRGFDFTNLLEAVETAQMELGVASFELHEPSLDEVCLAVIERATGTDPAANVAAEVEVLRELDAEDSQELLSLQSTYRISPRRLLARGIAQVARLRWSRFRLHWRDDVMLAVIVPFLLIATAFAVPAALRVNPSQNQCVVMLRDTTKVPPKIPSSCVTAVHGGVVPRRSPTFRMQYGLAIVLAPSAGTAEIVYYDNSLATAQLSTAVLAELIRSVDPSSVLPNVSLHLVPEGNDGAVTHEKRDFVSRLFAAIAMCAALCCYLSHAHVATTHLSDAASVLGPHGLGARALDLGNAVIDGVCSGLLLAASIVLNAWFFTVELPTGYIVVVLSTLAFCLSTALFCRDASRFIFIIMQFLSFCVLVPATLFLADSPLLVAIKALTPLSAFASNVVASRRAASRGVEADHSTGVALLLLAALACVHLPMAALAATWHSHPANHHVNRVVLSTEVPSGAEAEQDNENMDEDVRREAQRLLRASEGDEGRPSDAVAFQSVAYRYESLFYGSTVLKNVSWGVRNGQVLGFVGPNGAGKTTTLRLVIKELQALSPGGVTYGALPSDYVGPDLWQRIAFGYCPQEDTTSEDSSTALDYLRLHLELRLGRRPFVGEKAMKDSPQHFESIDAAQWWRYAVQTLGLLKIPVDVPVRQLSGGMKRRLTTALALFCGASIIVLDEPTNGVDPVARQLMWRVIRWWAKARQRAVIVTTHSMVEAESLCDTLALLRSGELRWFGAPAHLRAKFGKGFVAEVTVGQQTNVALLDEEMVAHFGASAAKVVTRSGGALRCYTIGEVPSLASTYRELSGIMVECGAEHVSVGRASLRHAYLEITR